MVNSSPFIMSLSGLAIASVLMALAWVFARAKNFLSLVDAIWAYGIGFLATLYFLTHSEWSLPKGISLALILFWSIRLGTHLTMRLLRHYPQEDRRYQELRFRWHRDLAFKSFFFFQVQAATQCFFAFPFAALAMDPPNSTSPGFWAGAALTSIGLIGEAIADKQLLVFTSQKSNHAAVCNIGLWRYSRHPNYFFEWIVWCGFGVSGWSAQSGGLSAACPVVMFFLLVYVTGVPPAESSSLRSRGQRYRDYQNSTSKFFPWFPKETA